MAVSFEDVVGGVLVVAGLAVAWNLLGAQDLAIRRITSRRLGSLAPGYAASLPGIRYYGVLLMCIGIAISDLTLLASNVTEGIIVFVAALLGVIVCSIIILRGEVRTYRSLKR